jgi:hypothetical protein
VSRRRPPDRKTIFIYLVLGLLIVAVVSLALGGGGWFRVVRLLVIYGGAFLLVLYVFRVLRRTRR